MALPHGAQVCWNCGSPMRPRPKQPMFGRVIRWFNEGRMPRGQKMFDCPSCGRSVATNTLQATTATAPRWFAELRGRRSMQPVPRFYAVLAIVGALIGAASSWLWSSPWWLGPIVTVTAGWAFMMSTAFHRAGTDPGRRLR